MSGEMKKATEEIWELDQLVDMLNHEKEELEKSCNEYKKMYVEKMEEVNRLHDEMDGHNMAAAKALDKLWADIMLKRYPDYGDWEYPGQAYRHILEAWTTLQAENKKLCEALEKLDLILGRSMFSDAFYYLKRQMASIIEQFLKDGE